MHEFGINPTGLNVHYGVARNPYDPSRDPGGSSSGSAVAVARGICPIAIGADGGGSIRIPAGLTGLVGLMPTAGRVPSTGTASLCWSLGRLGPLATCVADAEVAFRCIRDPSPSDEAPFSDSGVVSYSGDLRGVRIGIYDDWFDHGDPEVVSTVRAALPALEDAGAVVQPVVVDHLEEMRIAHTITILCEMAAAAASLDGRRSDFGPGVRVNLAIGRALSGQGYVRAQQLRTRAIRNLRRSLPHRRRDTDSDDRPPSAPHSRPPPAPRLVRSGDHRGAYEIRIPWESHRNSVRLHSCWIHGIRTPNRCSSDGAGVQRRSVVSPWRSIGTRRDTLPSSRVPSAVLEPS